MADVTITLPDGSSRAVPAGTPCATSPPAFRRVWPRRRSRPSVDDRLVDLTFPLERDATVRIVTPESPEALALYRHSTAHLLAAAVTNLFPGVQCGIGPATDEGFFYDFVVPRPFVPEDLEAIEKKMRELAQQDLPVRAADVAARRGEAVLRRPRRAAEGPADRREDRRPGRGLLLHDQGPRHVRRLLRRPARAVDRPAEGVQAAEHVERLLEGRRAQPADAAGLRHGVPLREGAAGSTCTRLEEAKKRDHRKIGRDQKLFMFHPWAPGATFWLAEGDDALQHARQLHARGAVPGGLRRGEGADRLQQGAVGNLRTLAALPPEHVPRRERRRADGAQGDELPRAHAPDVRQRDAQLPGPADPLSTSRRRCTATKRQACSRG